MDRTMRAVVKTHEMGFGAEWREVSIRAPGTGEILVKVGQAAVCGSDRDRYRWEPSLGKPKFISPIIIGHEMAGTVVETGAGVTRIGTGDRVAVETHIPCGTCIQCLTGDPHICHRLKVLGLNRDGCFSEYVTLPETCAVPLPPEVSFDQGALLEPMGIAYHALSKVKVSGNSVLVVGCGPIGLMAIELARIMGAPYIFAVAKHSFQREWAERMGATLVREPNPAEVKSAVLEMTDGYGVGVALEMTGSSVGVEVAFDCVRKGGEIVLVGFPKPMTFDFQNGLVRKELRVHGQHGRRMYQTWTDLLALLKAGLIDPSVYITSRLPLQDFPRGFELADRGDQIKVLLTP